MGQKVNAHGNRVGIIKDWDTKWYADKKNFATNLKQDDDIRKFIKKNYYKSAISKITIERAANKVTVNIHTGRPATIIGKQGAGVEAMKKEVQKFCPERNVNINVIEVKRPDMDAQLVAERIAEQLEARASFRRSMKQAMSKAIWAGAKGVKRWSAVVLTAQKSQEAKIITRVLFPFKLFARISTTALRKQNHVRSDRRKSLDLQRRSPWRSTQRGGNDKC